MGLGKMGGNMVLRLLAGGHRVVAYARTRATVDELAAHGATPAYDLAEVARALHPPRTVWLMLPAGPTVDHVLEELRPHLSAGDLVVDGGNSYYRDTLRRASLVRSWGLRFMDVGTSGGIWGLKEGYSMMAGGEREDVDRLRPVLQTLAPAPDQGWGHVGPVGSGHFVKMVHNGIEYGMMAAYAEGFAVMRAKEDFALDLAEVARIWQRGSVVRSWLLDLTRDALSENPGLEGIKPWVADSGEGRWTVTEALDLNVPAPIITLALEERIRSRDTDSFSDRLLAMMRNKFGGHAVEKENSP